MYIKTLVLSLLMSVMVGCATTDQGGFASQEQAQKASDWVKDRSGFIEAAVATATQVIVYSAEKDSDERAHINDVLFSVAANLNALISANKVDPDSVKAALKVKEAYFSQILAGVANIYAAEYSNLEKNGYISLAIEILKAVSRGVADATA